MANSDYTQATSGAFCPAASLVFTVGPDATTLQIAGLSEVSTGDAKVGSALLVGEEVMQVTEIHSDRILVKRGCADTIPVIQRASTPIFFLNGFVATDRIERIGAGSVSVKPLAKTSAGRVPLEYVTPKQVDFSHRMIRPYPPAQMRINGSPWYGSFTLTSAQPLVMTWVHRNRALQADQLLGQLDGGVALEAGASYEVRALKSDGTVVRVSDIGSVNTWTYGVNDAVADFSLTPAAETFVGYLTIGTKREGWSSWRIYVIRFSLDLSTIGTVAPAMAMENAGVLRTEDGYRIILE